MRHVHPGGERLFEQAGVVNLFSTPRQVVPRCVGNLTRRGFRRPSEIPDGDGDQDEYENQTGDPTFTGVFHQGTDSREYVAISDSYFSKF